MEVPEPLVPLVEARKESEQYPSVSRYMFWSSIYDITLQKPHRFTPWLMRQPTTTQHDYFESLIDNFGKETWRPGSWMENRIREEALKLIKSGAIDDVVIARAEAIGWRRGY